MRRTGIERGRRTETEARMKKNVPALKRTKTKNGTESGNVSGSGNENGNETGTVSANVNATANLIAIKETPKSARRFDRSSYWRVEAG